MDLVSIRGATTVESNDKNVILDAVERLIKDIEIANDIDRDRVISITFTATKELDKVYPAVAARKLGYLNTSLMCFQEMYVENSLEKCIRLSILCMIERKQNEVNHIYQNNARNLRPDLLGGHMEDIRKIVIAIDGPASAGKSTVAKNIAKKLNITYIDTGAMYRAITYKIYENNIDIDDLEKIKEILKSTKIDFKDGKIILDGRTIDKEIRENFISQRVSNVSKIKEVREKLVDIQRQMSLDKSVVMDGRDIGTVVLPDADFKFFVTASVEERARRRYEELTAKGDFSITLSQIEEEIRLRDEIDSKREIAPLVASEDAIIIDNSNYTMDETLTEILGIIRGRDVI